MLITDTNEARQLANAFIEEKEQETGILIGEGLDTGTKVYYQGSRVEFAKIFKRKQDALDENGKKTWYDSYHCKKRTVRLADNRDLAEVVAIEEGTIYILLDNAKPENSKIEAVKDGNVHFRLNTGDELIVPTIRMSAEEAELYCAPSTAITVYGAQGKTTQAVVELDTVNGLQTLESRYVGQSRARDKTIHVLSGDLRDDKKHSQDEIVARYAELMSRSAHKQTTLDFYDNVVSIDGLETVAVDGPAVRRRFLAQELTPEEVSASRDWAQGEVGREKKHRTGLPRPLKTKVRTDVDSLVQEEQQEVLREKAKTEELQRKRT
jgi:hypothetical protein